MSGKCRKANVLELNRAISKSRREGMLLGEGVRKGREWSEFYVSHQQLIY